MMKKFILGFMGVSFASVALAVPSTIDMPVDMSVNSNFCLKSSCEGWSFNQHKSGTHTPGGGIGGANDTYAWDINLNTPSFDKDNGTPVFVVEDGTIYSSGSWSGKSYGQILVNHTTGTDKWSTGYLHMKNIQKTSGFVKKGDILGYISNTSPDKVPNHLHFIVYSTHNGGKSTNVGFSGKQAKSGPGSGGASLKSIGVSCSKTQLSVSQTSACLAIAYYSDFTNKDVSKMSSWIVDKTSQATVSNGVVTAKGAAADTLVKASASFEGKTAFTNITVIGLDGKLPADYGCTSDGKNVISKKITGGEVVLMYSTKCGTNWTRVIPTSSNSITEANVRRTSDSKKYQYKGKGTIYTPMVYSPTTKSCAFGKIGTNSVADNTICK